MRIIPHSHEWLQPFFYNEPLGPDGEVGAATWVGPAPRLSTEDAGTSYADIVFNSEQSYYASVTFAPLADLRRPLRARVQMRVPGLTEPEEWQFSLGWEDDPIGWDTLLVGFGLFTLTSSEWETHEFDVEIEDVDFELLRDTYAPAGLMAAFVAYGPSATHQISLIQLMDGGRPIPTRVYPRADGLGMGAPRIMDGRSPYRSPRVFGQI